MGAMQVAIWGKRALGGEYFKALGLRNSKEVRVTHND